MTEVADKLIREALILDPVERATLIEELLSSLDKPDAELDANGRDKPKTDSTHIVPAKSKPYRLAKSSRG